MRDVARSRAESPRRTHTVVLAGWLAVAFVLAGCQVGGGTPDAGAPGGSDGSGDFDAGMDGAADGRAGPDAGHLDARDERDGRSGPSDVGTGWDFGTVDSSDGTAPFELDAIVPPSGPVDGGNRVRVVGQGLTAQVDLFIGGRRADVTRSGGELVARVPAAESPHRATVKVVGPDGRRRSLKDGYEYVSAIRVERVTPTRIPTDGGVQVEVRGQGFGPSVGVSVDRQSAWRVDRIDSGLLRFVAPPGSAGPADLRLTTRHESAVVEDALEYVAPLSIDGLAPAAGSTAGGDRVVVEGGGFGPRARVTFGGERATVLQREKGGKKLVVRTPAHPAGTVDIGVQSGGDAVLAADAFVYQSSSQPTVASLSPGSGPASGGTKVRIVGRGFDRKNLQVAFGGKSASVVEKKPTFLRVETPAASPGTVDVVVRAAGSKIGELTDGFRYVEDLFVDSVSPDAGPAAGGTDVTIRGTGFQGVDEVTFGGLPASFDVRSNSKLRATTPAHAAGKVDVVLHRGETTARHRDAFTYRTDVEIWGFSPVRGAIAGGTYVEVRGKGFIGRVSAELDGSSVNGIRRIDRNNLFFYTPSHPTGTAELTVQSEVGKAKGPYPFRYFNPASRKGGASGGPVRGAVNVTVLAQGGGPIEGAFVMLSTRRDTPHSGTTDANGQVTLSGPGVQGAQTVTATAKGFTSTTVRDIDSENLTLFLRSKSPSNGGGGGGGGDPPMATIEGTVRAPVKFGNPDDKVSWEMAVVRTTMESIGGRRIEPGPNSVIRAGGDYELRSRIGDVAVVALCGMYSPKDEQFQPEYIGVKRYLSVADGKTYRADIVCDRPLDRTLDVKLRNPVYAPGGPNINRAEVYWDFGFSGVFPSPTDATGQGKLLKVSDQPPLTGNLSGVELTVVAGSFTGERSPSTQMHVSGVTDYDTPVVMPPLLDVPEPASPRAGGEVEGRRIRFQAATPPEPDMYSIYLLDQKGRPFWRYLMSGDSNTIQLPSFPDFSYLPRDRRPDPFSADEGHILIFAIEGDRVAFDDFSYADLSSSKWRGYAITRWGLTFPSAKRD